MKATETPCTVPSKFLWTEFVMMTIAAVNAVQNKTRKAKMEMTKRIQMSELKYSKRRKIQG